MAQVERFLLEGCSFDPLLDDEEQRERVLEADRRGLVMLLVTELTYQDLWAIKDDARREKLLAIVEQMSPLVVGLPAVVVDPGTKRARPTYPGAVYPVGEEDALLLRRLGLSQRADARQAVAAHWAGACLVTDDQTLVRRARAEAIHAMSTSEFTAEIARLLGAAAKN
ncbi:hypothetical protein [Ornithinimicrobium pekingense]|uniref:PIN domain-containing protein n=1 Tax=Ornithinimicrobium pekingense TaxID=384677 RepID=A0ABQ2F866_9MICO|nr:hypothetical protein [Ornithinimicrobium pekingense]GGK70926.1 hypothetical protein GCM10011509_19200 [Ornithinimicrobium pekingense]